VTFNELHDILTRECDLLPEPEHGGAWRTYYFKKIDRHPATSTRTVKVFLTQGDTPFKIQLCASSDNNNSVFLNSPFDADTLKTAIKAEIELLPGKNTSNH
jgi:hypothetical protein